MAENNNNLGFWQLTYEFFKKDVKKPEDGLIVLVHWVLLKNEFKVLGPGSENEIAENEQSSDILPENWSEKVISYYMRYTRDNILYLLNSVKVGGNSIVFNFYNVTTKHVSSATIDNIDMAVKYINDVLNNKDIFLKTIEVIQKDLINPLPRENDDRKNASTQTNLDFQYDRSRTANQCMLLDFYQSLTGIGRRQNVPRVSTVEDIVNQLCPPAPEPMMPVGDGQLNLDHETLSDFEDDM